MNLVKFTNLIGETKYPVKQVNIVKSHGGTLLDSKLHKGYILQLSRSCQQMPIKVRVILDHQRENRLPGHQPAQIQAEYGHSGFGR